MSGLFSQHVQSVSAGGEIDPAIRSEIGAVLRSELRRRGILEYGPSLLGYLGRSWDDQEAMDDLIHDCYVRAIATRLPGLRRNLEKSGDIERLVRRNIRCFVGEQQAALDPVGYAVYQNCKAVALELTELGVLRPMGGDTASMTTDTILAFVSAPATGEGDDARLTEALRETGQLFDGLETLVQVGAAAQERLANAVRGIATNGVARFTLGSLKRCICELVDEASIFPKLASVMSLSSLKSDLAENFRTVPPDAGYQQSEDVTQLAQVIREDIATLPRSSAVKARLCRLLDYLTDTARSGDVLAKETLDDLAERFQVSRSTMHDDFQSLRSVARRHAQPVAKIVNGDRHD